MNKIIEINNESLTAVAGGCWCYCYRKPTRNFPPTIMIGEVSNDKECRGRCESDYLGYSDCDQTLPRDIISDDPPSYSQLSKNFVKAVNSYYRR